MLWSSWRDITSTAKWFLLIDFKKAFEAVSRNFLFKTLQAYGFGPSFMQWISTFYKNISSVVLNNGFSTAPFSSGTRGKAGRPLVCLCVHYCA